MPKRAAGWDSIRQIAIIVAAEMQFGIRLSTLELDRPQSVGELVRSILEKT